MSDGQVIASGRDSEIVDLGGGRVLRRPRQPRPLDGEAAVMRYARAAGFPAPEVYEVRPDGLVMQRLSGPTMLDDLAAHPWRVHRHAHALAALHHDLHAIPAVDGLPAPFGGPGAADVLLHGDFHPANVLLTGAGPVLIDWSSAARGPAGADVADVWLVVGTARPPGGALIQVMTALLRERFLTAFLRRAGRSEAAPYLARVAELRAADPNLTEVEKTAMRRLAAAHGTR